MTTSCAGRGPQPQPPSGSHDYLLRSPRDGRGPARSGRSARTTIFYARLATGGAQPARVARLARLSSTLASRRAGPSPLGSLGSHDYLLRSPRDGRDPARSGRSARTTIFYARLATGGAQPARVARLARLSSPLASRRAGPSPLGSLGSHYHPSQWTRVSSGSRRRATLRGAAAWLGST